MREFKSKDLVDVHAIAEFIRNTQKKRILISGKRGSGKTMLIKNLKMHALDHDESMPLVVFDQEYTSEKDFENYITHTDCDQHRIIVVSQCAELFRHDLRDLFDVHIDTNHKLNFDKFTVIY